MGWSNQPSKKLQRVSATCLLLGIKRLLLFRQMGNLTELKKGAKKGQTSNPTTVASLRKTQSIAAMESSNEQGQRRQILPDHKASASTKLYDQRGILKHR